jgi:hypothetical protein
MFAPSCSNLNFFNFLYFFYIFYLNSYDKLHTLSCVHNLHLYLAIPHPAVRVGAEIQVETEGEGLLGKMYEK